MGIDISSISIIMITEREKYYLGRAIELSRLGMEKGQGGPFGCVIVRGDTIVGEGSNMVTSSIDPTAHAEVVAIRAACKQLNNYQLTDCEIFCSCEPCPMCLGAIYWARPRKVIFANTREDAAGIDFDDDFIYQEINLKMTERKIPFVQYSHPDAKAVFDAWKQLLKKSIY